MTRFRQPFKPGYWCSLALFLLSSACLYAQGIGTILGTVTDPSGAASPGAAVTVTDTATGLSRQATSNTEGQYTVPALRPSNYDLTVTAPGFAPYTQKGIQLGADQSASVNVKLTLAQTGVEITVNAAVAQVDTTTATMSEVVDRQRMVDLPLNGRNAASLALVVAGAITVPSSGDADQGNTKTFPVAVPVSTNGTRANTVNFRLDGANNNDIYTNVNQPFPFPDALQEFSVQTSNYSARYGGNSGGVVNIVTKAGANDIHGDVFEFVRNAEFNARNFFSARRDQLKRNQFGGTLGGPLSIPGVYKGRNKTFFFAGYQGTRARNVSGGLSSYVPTPNNLNGDFSALLDAKNPANPLGKAVQILDPVNGTPFAGNLIPVSRYDRAAVALTRYLPSTGGSGLVNYTQPLAQNFNEFLGRIDHSFSEHDRLFGRYFFDRFSNVGFLDQKNYLSATGTAAINSHNFLLDETHMFSPSLLNELRLSFSRIVATRGPAAGSVGVNDLGLNIYQPSTKTLEGINVSGYFNLVETDPADFVRNLYTINEDMTWIHGRHNIAYGVTVSQGQNFLRNQFRTSASFGFTSDVTNNAMASFLMGKLRTFTQGFGEFKDSTVPILGFYLQDDIRISKRLTFNLGMRYDPMYVWRENRGRVTQFRTEAYAAGLKSTVYTNAPKGLLFPGDPGVPKEGATGDFNNWSPRFGFAYDLSGTGRTSIRGGLGMFYDAQQNGIINNKFVDSTPFSPQLSLTTPQGPFSNPYLGITNPYPAPFPPPQDAAFPTPVAVITYDPANNAKLVTPVVYNWDLSLEHQLAGDWMVRLVYVGTHGSHLMETVELNPAVNIPGSPLGTDQRRAYQPFGSIAQGSWDINSIYHSLQATVQKRFSHNFTILANYTWSKALDDMPAGMGVTGISPGGSPIPWSFLGRHQFDRGPAEFDRGQRIVVSYVWILPSLASSPGYLRHTFGGWQMTGIVTAQSGGALTMTAGKDASLTGLGSDRAVVTSSDIYSGNACLAAAPCLNWINPSAFTIPTTGTFGNVGKGAVRAPGIATWDAGLFKNFALIPDRATVQFRAEFFNVLNRVNPNSPTTNVSAAGVGSIRSAGDPRIGQLALKIVF